MYVDVGMQPSDFNGDGYSDLAAAAPDQYNGAWEEGTVFVFPGGPGGLSPELYIVIDNPDNQVSGLFGEGLSASDLNADGFVDLVVGASGQRNGTVTGGSVFVFLGGETGPALRPSERIDSPSIRNYSWFGDCVDAGGDVDGDGYFDVVIGEPGYFGAGENEGRAYVLLGGADGLSDGPPIVLDNPAREERDIFGAKLAILPDIDGDGFSDVAVGSSYFSGSSQEEGAVYVYQGGPDGIRASDYLRLEAPESASFLRFGSGVNSAADVNGDGASDLAVTTSCADCENRLYVFYGTAIGTFGELYSMIDVPSYGMSGGVRVGGGCDMDGDGRSEVSYALPGLEGGKVFLHRGGADGPGPEPFLVLASPESGEEGSFGLSHGCVGDLDGDGFWDLAAGAPMLDQDGLPYVGKVFVYYGVDGGIMPEPSSTLVNPILVSPEGHGSFGRLLCLMR